MTAAALPTEIELKLRLPRRAVPALLRHPAIRAVKAGRARTARIASTYFDTADCALAAADCGLRLRDTGRGYVQTLKGPAEAGAGGGLSARQEFEWMLAKAGPRPGLDFALLAATPHAEVIARALAAGPFVAQFTVDVERTSVPLRFDDGTTGELCVDVGTGFVGERRSPGRPRFAIAEVELELRAGAPARLFELALALVADLPLAVEPASKAERGYALLRGETPGPATAAPLAFPPEAPAGAALAAIVGNCLQQIERNVSGLLASDDPEWIHQMRVGVRRLRTLFRLLRRELPEGALADLDAEWRWLAQALAPARDLDVLVGTTLPAMQAALCHVPDGGSALGPALAELEERARVALGRARSAARAAVGSSRTQSLLLRTAAKAQAPALGVADEPMAASLAAAPARDLGVRLLDRWHRRLRRLGRKLAELGPAERHAVRIAAKRVRYATEFFAPAFPGAKTRSYRKALAGLQEELGRWNDGAAGAALAARLTSPVSPASAACSAWAAAQGQSGARELGAAWRRFTAAKAFWARD